MSILVTRQFQIGDKEYNVKQMSVMDILDLRQHIFDTIKAKYRAELRDIIDTIPEKDRVKFWIEALKSQSPTEEQVGEYIGSKDGLVCAISIALKLGVEDIKKLMDIDNEKVMEMYEFLLGKNEEVEEKKTE